MGLGSRSIRRQNGRSALTFWYTLPVRTASPCFDEEGGHALSVIGSNQMDPTGYLHLTDMVHDIRPSKIGVYSWYGDKSCRMMIIDFQDGRLHELAEEPYLKIREASQSIRDSGSLDLHVVLLSSSARWWRHALSRLKKQLLHYVISNRVCSTCNG